MFGGPFYSAGAVRIINGETYRYRGVGFAYWVTLMNGGHSADYFEIHRNGRFITKVKTREEVEKYFDTIASMAEDTLRRRAPAAEAPASSSAPSAGPDTSAAAIAVPDSRSKSVANPSGLVYPPGSSSCASSRRPPAAPSSSLFSNRAFNSQIQHTP
jgi:hypothetical protein